MAAEIRSKFFRILVRASFVFEPIAPRFLSHYIGQKFKSWKQQNLILGYKTRSKRLGKFHYKIKIDVSLNPEQSAYLLHRLTSKRRK